MQKTLAVVAVLGGFIAAPLRAVAQPGAVVPPARLAILQAEERRAAKPADLITLRTGLCSRDPQAAILAIRAMGRLEGPALMTDLIPALRFALPQVRAEAANAIGQAAQYGLMFHRVVPNFVIQGGSPAANEYVGTSEFMRDEVGLWPHVRGALGLSTRGRDTADGKFFVNLVDNARFDHEYTVFAQVLNGMDVIDRLLEGDVIERVEIIP